ncbi:MAG: hypothetical protein ACOCP4_06050, partial [Candidatus Woesearchaeota archaeon]
MNAFIKKNETHYYNEVRSLAFRYNKGPSGGPGGSNNLLEISNFEMQIIPNFYCFYRETLPRRSVLFLKVQNFCSRRRFLRKIGKALKQNYVITEKKYFLKRAIDYNSKNIIYLAHDVWSAEILSKVGKPFIMAYHQQGSRVVEKQSFGVQVTSDMISSVKESEKFAFLPAQKVIFTSKGAKNSFLETSPLSEDELSYID